MKSTKLALALLKTGAKQLLKAGDQALGELIEEGKTTLSAVPLEQVKQRLDHIRHNPKLDQVTGLVREIFAEATAGIPHGNGAPAPASAAPTAAPAQEVDAPAYDLAVRQLDITLANETTPTPLLTFYDGERAYWEDNKLFIELPHGKENLRLLDFLLQDPKVVFSVPQKNARHLRAQYRSIVIHSQRKPNIQQLSSNNERDFSGIRLTVPFNNFNDLTTKVNAYFVADAEFEKQLEARLVPGSYVVVEPPIVVPDKPAYTMSYNSEPATPKEPLFQLAQVGPRGDLRLLDASMRAPATKRFAYDLTDVLRIAPESLVTAIMQRQPLMTTEGMLLELLYHNTEALTYDRYKS